MVTIDFIRHGEPQGGRLYRGAAVDDPLSEKGWSQMWAAVGETRRWDRIVSSPLQRCLAFAEALAQRDRLPLAAETDLREVGFGEWEGLSPEEVKARDPEGYAAFYRDPVECRPPGAEDLILFGHRVADAYDRIARHGRGERVLVVAHAGVIRAALGHVLQAPPSCWYRVQVDNAGITRFRHEKGADRLLFHNRSRPS